MTSQGHEMHYFNCFPNQNQIKKIKWGWSQTSYFY